MAATIMDDGGKNTSSLCVTKESQLPLDLSAQEFLNHLGLPLQHPLCASKETSLHVHDELSSIGNGVFEIPSVHPLSNVTMERLSFKDFHRAPALTQERIRPPEIGSISLMELHDGSRYELFLTATTMAAPTLAMAELWLRLFAFFLAPLCLAWLIHREVRFLSESGDKKKAKEGRYESMRGNYHYLNSDENKLIAINIIGLASSVILFTDSLYVYEFGRNFGFSLFALSSILAIRACVSDEKILAKKKCADSGYSTRKKRALFRGAVFSLIFTATTVFLRSDGGHFIREIINKIKANIPLRISSIGALEEGIISHVNAEDLFYDPVTSILDPGIDIPTIEEGLYFASWSDLASSIVSYWPESSRTYTVGSGATPYLVNGDQRTGIPFLIHKVEEQEYVRAWVTNPYDGEILALDIAFPYSELEIDEIREVRKKRNFVHDSDKPVYLVLHGLNGGSHEEYVKDFVKRRRNEGSTVVVLIARGMMDTYITNGWNVFHGARTGDVDIAARALKRGLDSLAKAKQKPQRQMLGGVGYSMGAIILSNYVARSGKNCALDAAVAVSGGLDMRQQLNFRRSMRLWQPMLTFGLREDILIGKYARHYKHRLTREQFLKMLRVTSISVSCNNFLFINFVPADINLLMFVFDLIQSASRCGSNCEVQLVQKSCALLFRNVSHGRQVPT
ncbi:hypothetical protein ACHAXS_006969 [Conticribra weissflogii]